MNYKYLVAADMDNTLILPGSDITEQSIKAIKKLRSYNIAFTFATGRSHFMVGTYIDKLDIDIPVITCNGGNLYNPKTKSYIYSKNFTPLQVKNILNDCFASNEFIDVTGYSSEGIYVRKESCRIDFFTHYNSNAKDDLKIPLLNLDSSILSIPNNNFPYFSKLLIVDASQKFVEKLKRNNELEVVSSAPGFCDVMPAGQTKGNGLIQLSKYLKIPIENTFAFGDSNNDESMLIASGLGIAMGNSTDKILKIANKITRSCAEDGFAFGVDNIVIPSVIKN